MSARGRETVKFLDWSLVGIYEAWCSCMMRTESLLLVIAFLNMCQAQCSAGTYWNSQYSSCWDCVAGKYTTVSTATTCDSCTWDMTSGVKASACVSCPAGKVRFPSGSGACVNCYATNNGECVKINCAPGSYWTTGGVCRKCPAQTYSKSYPKNNEVRMHISDCLACPSGTLQPSTGASSASQCVPCPANTYFQIDSYFDAPTRSMKYTYQCATCPAGKKSTIVGASVASVCVKN